MQAQLIPDEALWALASELHSNVPAEDRPMSWSDFSPEQIGRLRRAATKFVEVMHDAAQAYVVRLEARLANYSNDWTEIFPSQLEWVAKAGHQVRAIELAAQPPAAPVCVHETCDDQEWCAGEPKCRYGSDADLPTVQDVRGILGDPHDHCDAPAQCSTDSAIADALERCDWANVSIGNKAVIRAAVVALRAQPQAAPEIQNVGNEAVISDIPWAVNYLLEQIAAKFEAWDTLDLFRSEAASTVRSFKHDLSSPLPRPEHL